MKTITYLGLIVIAALFQVGFFVKITSGSVVPNIVFVLSALLVIFFKNQEPFVWAVFGGLVLDYFSLAPFGAITLTMLITLLGILIAISTIIKEPHFIASIILVILGVFTFNILYIGILYLSRMGIPVLGYLKTYFIAELMWSLVISVGFYLPLQKLSEFWEGESRKSRLPHRI